MNESPSDVKLNFNELITDIQAPMFRFIMSLIPHKHDAEDILQKTNIILFKKQKLFNPKLSSFKNWCFTIAKFQVMGHNTKHCRSKICFSNELTEILADESECLITDTIKQNALNKCYKKLPKHMSKMADLRFKRDLSIKEISLCLGRPIGSVSATIYRIRTKIMSCINEAYNEAEKEFNN